MARHSKLQLQILSLYRTFLRESNGKPGLQEMVKSEFRKHSALPRTDVMRIEHLYRKAERQLKQIKSSQVLSAGTFSKQ